MIIRSIKLVHKVNVFACKIIISSRLWRVGYRQVVLGRRKHFGCPKTQLAIRLTSLIFLPFVLCICQHLHTHSKITFVVDFSFALGVYMRASTRSLNRKIRLNINFQCLKITIQQSKFYSNISIGALVITLAGYLFITNKQIKQ